MKQLKLAVGITGASGMIYARRFLQKLQNPELKNQIEQAGLVFSSNVPEIWKTELGAFNPDDFAMKIYSAKSFYAPFASGSAGYDALVVIPCSMGTLGRISAGISNDLITRAADVMLKEQKKLILVTREMPFSLIHLENMTRLARAGAQIFPASPHFYLNPKSFNELADTVVNRVLEAAGFRLNMERWTGDD
jgi:4-hydroxy-3-polyprenylbenzoate decarboxylase